MTMEGDEVKDFTLHSGCSVLKPSLNQVPQNTEKIMTHAFFLYYIMRKGHFKSSVFDLSTNTRFSHILGPLLHLSRLELNELRVPE